MRVRKIDAKRHISREEELNLVGEHIDESFADTIISGGDEVVEIYKEDGSLLLKYLPGVLSSKCVDDSYDVFKYAASLSRPDNRQTAVGNKFKGVRYRKDGTAGNTTAIPFLQTPELQHMYASVMGFTDRYVRFPLCRATAFNAKNPILFDRTVPFLQEVSDVFKDHVPHRHKAQKIKCDLSHQDYIIPGTVFTSITVNRNFRVACHYDAGDLKEGFGCLSAITKGEYEGSYTVFPAHRVGVDLRTGDVLLADVHELHGNTPYRRCVPGKYERVAMVMYYREGIVECESLKDEIKRAKSFGSGSLSEERRC